MELIAIFKNVFDFLLGLVHLKQVVSCIFLFSQITFLLLVCVHITFSIRFTVIGLGCCLSIVEFVLSRIMGLFCTHNEPITSLSVFASFSINRHYPTISILLAGPFFCCLLLLLAKSGFYTL